MIQIDDAIVALDIIEENFLCDLSACMGECCVEGESGAPLEKEEVAVLEEILPLVWDDLSPEAQKVIQKTGVAYKDTDGEMVTSIVNGKDCVFTYYDEKGICKCAIEKAHKEGKTDFYKPISCHLYPIRLQKYRDFTAVNYHRWSVCKAAVALGNKEGLKIYQFLKTPLIRKFGEAWYNELCIAVDEYKR
ncbi:MAG: DUF3109 family protein [Dysgonomonas sp.]|uniref:DUF3109 family protein n=1 Tax=Dysgonomonas sp. TaxID=1891233 RepID=UPI0039E70392